MFYTETIMQVFLEATAHLLSLSWNRLFRMRNHTTNLCSYSYRISVKLSTVWTLECSNWRCVASISLQLSLNSLSSYSPTDITRSSPPTAIQHHTKLKSA